MQNRCFPAELHKKLRDSGIMQHLSGIMQLSSNSLPSVAGVLEESCMIPEMTVLSSDGDDRMFYARAYLWRMKLPEPKPAMTCRNDAVVL